jgi:hypothetical protein
MVEDVLIIRTLKTSGKVNNNRAIAPCQINVARMLDQTSHSFARDEEDAAALRPCFLETEGRDGKGKTTDQPERHCLPCSMRSMILV